eukprot:TRINITY_DN3564_c0_g1_i1.p1 TRINITY_DN3564_c0_g1~~TRINITY_DN3564_c0_g1_i1.p1  ORF type:complete len:316 (-),score=32.48 TRINITY_DN3564_c0_g1_i1:93-989(-)
MSEQAIDLTIDDPSPIAQNQRALLQKRKHSQAKLIIDLDLYKPKKRKRRKPEVYVIDDVCWIGKLPKDLIVHLCLFLDDRSKCRMQQTCKRFQKFCASPPLWSTLRLFKKDLTSKKFRFLFYKYRNLQKLHFKSCHSSSKTFNLLRYCPDLKSISFSHMMDLRDKELRQIVDICTKLESVSLTRCTQVTNNGLQILSSLKNFKTLKLKEMDTIEDEALDYFNQGQHTLEKVCLVHCLGFTDEGMKILASLASLKEVRIYGLSKVSPQGLTLLMNSHIPRLYLFGCGPQNKNQIYKKGI